MESLKLPSIGGSPGNLLPDIGAGQKSPFSSGGKEKKHRSKHRGVAAGGDLDLLDVERIAAKKRRKEEKRRQKLAAAAAAADEGHSIGGTHERLQKGGDMSSEFRRQHQVMSNSSPIHMAPHPQQPKHHLEDAISVSGERVGIVGMQNQMGFLGIADEDMGRDEQRRVKKKNRSDPEKELRRKKKQARRAKKMEKAAIMLQKAYRAKFARAVAHRMRRRKLFALAAQSGVLLACEGTKQGSSGWYQQTEDSIPVYYEVNELGEWKLIM